MAESQIETDLFRSLGESFFTGPLHFGQALSQTGQLRFYNASSALATIIQGGNATAAITYVLPTAGPAANNYLLASSTTGTLSWLNAAGTFAPIGSAFVTVGNDATLTAERALTGTANQITITDNGANSTVVLSTPQNIHTGASPTFTGLTLSGTLNVSDGTLGTATGAIYFSSDTNTGWYRAGADDQRFFAAGADVIGFSSAIVAYLDVNLNNHSVTGLAVGSVGSPSLSFTSDSNTGVFSGGADDLRLVTAGASRIIIQSTVLINTTLDMQDNRITTLAVGSTASAAIQPGGDANTGIIFPAADQCGITAGGSENFRVDNNSTAGNVRIFVYDVDNATLERVSVGIADSGGTGFKVLRIPN